MRTNAEPHETIIHFIQKLNGILNIADVAETHTHILLVLLHVITGTCGCTYRFSRVTPPTPVQDGVMRHSGHVVEC